MKKYYRIYGMLLASDLEIEEAMEHAPVEDDQIDVRIETGDFDPDIKEKLKTVNIEGSFSFYKHDSMFFCVEKVASYHVRGHGRGSRPDAGQDLFAGQCSWLLYEFEKYGSDSWRSCL